MRKTVYSIVLAGVWLTACTEAGPVVQDAATYSVSLTQDIVYGEGLGYDPRGDDERMALPLKLDVYAPENTADRRPVFVWIHGGGFTGGSKTADDIEEMADFYATRDWVFVSLNYRTTEVMGDGYEFCKGDAAPDYEEAVAYYQGITPPEWTRYSCAGTENRLNFHQSIAMYAAQRDAKAALRWVVSNASTYNIDVNHITVGGNSAGAITAAPSGLQMRMRFEMKFPQRMTPLWRPPIFLPPTRCKVSCGIGARDTSSPCLRVCMKSIHTTAQIPRSSWPMASPRSQKSP